LLEIKIDLIYITAQLIGFAAMACGIISFQSKRRVSILTFQTVSNILWVIHYLMLGAVSAVVANAIGIVRNLVYMQRGKRKFADSIFVPIFFVAAFLLSGIITYETPFSLLPMLAMAVATVAFFVTNENLIRWMSLGIAVPWLTFGVYAGSVASVISDGTNLISIIISLIRYKGAYSTLKKGSDDEMSDEISN
jgi:hypothetical protein